MPVLLNVPYTEKEEAKALGAKWDPKLTKWYAVWDYPKFKKWILWKKDYVFVISNYVYIVEGTRKCYKCHKNTPVIGFGYDKMWSIGKDPEMDRYYHDKENLGLVPRFNPMPPELLILVQKTYNFKKAYSRMARESYWGNCCEFCKSLQGDFFLFEELDSPFAEGNEKDLKVYPIRLKYDLVVDEINPGMNDAIEKAMVQNIAPVIELSDTIVRI